MQLIKHRIFLFFGLCLTVSTVSFSQVKKLISGPWAGNVQLKTAIIWAEVDKEVKTIAVKYYVAGNQATAKTVNYSGQLHKDFNPVKIELVNLQFNTKYNYELIIDSKRYSPLTTYSFTTKDLWEWRKPAPDFSFLAGSCSYVNEPIVDRPGKPYGGDSSIFETMANTPAAFHVWLGDNWYLREVDFNSAWGINYRASRDRSMAVLQNFMAAMPQYGIWDDHDYGPNDANKSYQLKEFTRKTFTDYWCNPSYGENGEGIYTKISYSDVDIFLTDNRWFRSDVSMADSIDGKPNADKTYFGYKQMDWLKNALLFSNATFKIIVSGSQVINPLSTFDCMKLYTREYNELINFLSLQKIKGVIFFSGDRHHSEVIKVERKNLYPLYDVTVSPYTSGISRVKEEEINSPYRINGTLVEQQNFAKVNISGNKGDRKLAIEFIGLKGVKLAAWNINQKDLE